MSRSVRRPAATTRLRRLLAAGGAAALGLTALSALQAMPAQALNLPPQCVTSGTSVTCTFTSRGTNTGFAVPYGVTSMQVQAIGERGAPATLNGSTVAIGGAPAVVQGTVPVAEGDVISVRLLDDGGAAGPSSGGGTAGAGGDSVQVLRNSNAVAHAAGGGGAGVTKSPAGNSSDGGAAGQPGVAGNSSSGLGNPALGGGPGQQNAGGTGGTGGVVDACGPMPAFFPDGQNGAVQKGGNGGPGDFGGFGGGGGGGGRFGGGGGGAGGEGCFSYAYAAGGGGGSSTVMPGGMLGLAGTFDPSYRVVLSFTLARRSNHAPASINFGNTPVGTQSAFQSFTLNNTGSAAISVGTGVIGGSQAAQFVKGVDNCSGKTIPDGASCTVQLAFKPSVAGAASATFTISDNSPQSPHTIQLSGNGTQPVAFIQTSNVSFGAAEVGRSADRTIVLGNFGNAPLNVSSATLGGANGSDFTKVSDTCTGNSVAVNSTCSVAVRFTAGAVGTRSGTLTFTHNANPTTSVANLSGIGTPPADLKIRGIGSIYTGRDRLVTRTVTGAGKLMTYPLVILNEDTVARSYRIRLTKAGAAAAAEVWTAGFKAAQLAKDGNGDYVTASVLPGKTVSYNLRVTPTAPGQVISAVDVALLSADGGLIEGIDTETNTQAPANGSTAYELFAKQGGQPYVGGPVDGQTATGPALNVNNIAAFAVRLKNNGSSAARIGLRLTDVDGCAGAFAVTVTAGGVNQTAAAFNGTYQTASLNPGQYRDVQVSIKRVGNGCPAKKIRAQSLSSGSVVRTSYLLANSAYNAAVD